MTSRSRDVPPRLGRHQRERPPRELFVVRSGWLHASTVFGNGSRQIMRFHFQGDILGLPLLAFADSPETVTAVTDVMLCPFTREKLAALIAEHPRLGALILGVSVADQVTPGRPARRSDGPRRAPGSGALICEIFARMRRLGAARGDGIPLPLTQEDIGHATGLTSVHVNRMMRRLAEDGIIERNGGQIRLLDEEKRLAESNFIDRSGIETGWLPPAR